MSCLAHAAWAQTPQDIERAQQQGQQLLQQQQQLERQQRELEESRRRAPSGADLRTTPPAPVASEGPCSRINDIVLDGATRLSESEQVRLVQPYLGKCLALADINRLISEITNDYVERGYITTRAYIPQQDLAGGRLTLKIVEGRVESLRMDPAASGSVATAFPGLAGGILNLRDFEQGIDQLNRLSSNSARIDIEPGADPGTSQVVVHDEARKRWLASISVDNSGSASTGYDMVAASFGIDNALGFNDYFNLNARHSEAGPGTARSSDSGGLYWNLPYGYWNFSTAVNGFDYKSLVQGTVSSFVTKGTSDSQALRADRVVYRDQSRKWSFTGGLTLKQTRNYIAGEKIVSSSADLTLLDLGTSLTWAYGGALFSLNAGITRGVNALEATKDDHTRPDGAPQAQYQKITYGASVLKSFEAGPVPLSWQTTISGQDSHNALYGTEQIAIGNLYTVRGFRTTVLSGKGGAYVRNDLGMPLPLARLLGSAAPNGQIRPYIGYDAGHIASAGTLSGWAAGVALSAGPATLQIMYARPLSMPSFFTRETGWLYASLALTY